MSFWPFLVLQLAIFIGLVFALRRILSRNITDATAHLRGLNAEYSRRHEELKQRIAEAEQQYREQMTRAKTEGEQLVLKARQDAESSKTRFLDDARTESERIVQQALESRDAIRKEIEQAMEGRAIERACELIQEALPGQLRQDIQSRLVDELIQDGLAQLDGLTTEEQVSEARVVSAFPLSEEQRRALRERLTKRLGREVAITEEINDRLVAGFTITLGSLVLDGSLASKVRGAARQAQHEA